MSDYVARSAGSTVLHQVCVSFSLNDIFDDGSAPADAHCVRVDPRSRDIRVTQGLVNGQRRIVMADVVRVLFCASAATAMQYVRRLKENDETWDELRPHLLYIQFSGHGVKALATLTLEGTYILDRKSVV